MHKGLIIFIAVVVALLNRAALAFESGNTVGFSAIELRPGVNQYHTYMQEIGGGSLKIKSFLRFATEGDRVIYDENGEMRVAVATRVDDGLRWFDLERNEELGDVRLPYDSNGSKLIYESRSLQVKEVSLAGESASFHDPKRVSFPPPPPKVVKLSLPFKKRPTGRFCMIVRKDKDTTERLDVRLSDWDTIVYADTGEEVRRPEKDIIGFEEFVPAENPLAKPQPNMSKEGVERGEADRRVKERLKETAVEVFSLIKGEKATWGAIRMSLLILALTALFNIVFAWFCSLCWRGICFVCKLVFVRLLWEDSQLNALPWVYWRLRRRVGWILQSVADEMKTWVKM